MVVLAYNSNMDGYIDSLAKNTSTTNPPMLEFIGFPFYEFLDQNNDGYWDIIWYSQVINVTSPGLFEVSRKPPSYWVWNATGESNAMGIGTIPSYISIPQTGLMTISYWYSNGDHFSFIPGSFYSYDFLNLTYRLTVVPLYENYTQAGSSLIGPSTEFTLSNWKDIPDIKYYGYNIVSPWGAKYSTSLPHKRTVGDQFEWNIFNKYNKEIDLGLNITDTTGGLYSAIVTNTTEKLQFTIDDGTISQTTISGYPFTFLIIPGCITEKMAVSLAREFLYEKLAPVFQNNGILNETVKIETTAIYFNLSTNFNLSTYTFRSNYQIIYNLTLGALQYFHVESANTETSETNYVFSKTLEINLTSAITNQHFLPCTPDLNPSSTSSSAPSSSTPSSSARSSTENQSTTTAITTTTTTPTTTKSSPSWTLIIVGMSLTVIIFRKKH